jgi:hypothetical protein
LDSKGLSTFLPFLALNNSLAPSISAWLAPLSENAPGERVSELEKETKRRKRHDQNLRPAIVYFSKWALETARSRDLYIEGDWIDIYRERDLNCLYFHTRKSCDIIE